MSFVRLFSSLLTQYKYICVAYMYDTKWAKTQIISLGLNT